MVAFVDYMNKLGIDYSDFSLNSDYFDHNSSIHGVSHTYRVMFMCLLIGFKINNKLDAKRAFMAAYIHDMARKNDGACLKHGQNSIKIKLPIFENIFVKNGLNRDDIEAIKLAVSNHSDYEEIDKNHKFHKTVAILRDADGLDLIRIGLDIDTEILRFKESIDLISLSEKIYKMTFNNKYHSFIDFSHNIIFNM